MPSEKLSFGITNILGITDTNSLPTSPRGDTIEQVTELSIDGSVKSSHGIIEPTSSDSLTISEETQPIIKGGTTTQNFLSVNSLDHYRTTKSFGEFRRTTKLFGECRRTTKSFGECRRTEGIVWWVQAHWRNCLASAGILKESFGECRRTNFSLQLSFDRSSLAILAKLCPEVCRKITIIFIAQRIWSWAHSCIRYEMATAERCFRNPWLDYIVCYDLLWVVLPGQSEWSFEAICSFYGPCYLGKYHLSLTCICLIHRWV